MNEGSCFFCGRDVRDHDPVGAPVQHECDLFGSEAVDANDGLGVGAGEGLELWENVGCGGAAVFEVEKDPVEAAESGEFGDDGRSGGDPGAELEFHGREVVEMGQLFWRPSRALRMRSSVNARSVSPDDPCWIRKKASERWK